MGALGRLIVRGVARSARTASRASRKAGKRIDLPGGGGPVGTTGRSRTDFTVDASDFFALNRRLKAASRDLRKDVQKELRDAAKPLIAETRREARAKLPSRGGFAEQVAREPQRVQVRTGYNTAGVRVVVGKKRGGARGADQGTIRHPVFGTGRYVSQSVPPGWFTGTMQDKAPDVRKDVEKVIKKTLDHIARKPL